MPAQVLQMAPSSNQLIENMTADTSSGDTANAAYKAPAPRLVRGPEYATDSAWPSKKEKQPRPSSEIGTPPQSFCLKNAEYGLFRAVRQPSATGEASAPGMNEQCRSCRPRSR